MAEQKLLTIREVSQILGISEKEVIDLAEAGTIPAYKIGGVYLRFKREQIDELRKEKFTGAVRSTSIKDRIFDFLYFNDFYIISTLIVSIILVIIFMGY